jgi:hypothetical protein
MCRLAETPARNARDLRLAIIEMSSQMGRSVPSEATAPASGPVKTFPSPKTHGNHANANAPPFRAGGTTKELIVKPDGQTLVGVCVHRHRRIISPAAADEQTSTRNLCLVDR